MGWGSSTHLFRVWMRHERQMGDHLLVSTFILFGALDDAIKHQHVSMAHRLEDENWR